jgi:hypothetical protein
VWHNKAVEKNQTAKGETKMKESKAQMERIAERVNRLFMLALTADDIRNLRRRARSLAAKAAAKTRKGETS